MYSSDIFDELYIDSEKGTIFSKIILKMGKFLILRVNLKSWLTLRWVQLLIVTFKCEWVALTIDYIQMSSLVTISILATFLCYYYILIHF